MLLGPRAGFNTHNVTVKFGTTPPTYINSTFNTSSKQITGNIGTPGSYVLTAYEKNYNMSMDTTITIATSNISIKPFRDAKYLVLRSCVCS